MSTVPAPPLPKPKASTPPLPRTKVPAWERRRNPDRWRWNGNRRSDPRLPRMEAALEANPVRVAFYAVAGSLMGLGILMLTLR